MASLSKCILDVTGMDIILRGKQWDRAEDPSNKNAIHLLERNEALVTWLQPKVIKNFFAPCKTCARVFMRQRHTTQGGSIDQQVPAINVNGKYFCSLSLRMQKSIWRHVRLRKGFVNKERLSQVKS